MSCCLGMDIGTGSVKAVLLSAGGVKEYREPYPGCRGTGTGSGPGPGRQDPGALRAALKALLSRIGAEEPVLMRELNGICIDGHGPSIIFIDGRGAPVSEIITWQDRSAAAEADELREKVPGFTKDGTGYEAKVLRGVREHPEWAEPGCTVLYPKDYAVLLLTGERIIDRSAASTIYFYAAPGYTQVDGRGLVPEDVFPKAVNSWEAAGTAGTEFSRECGLPSGTPVYAGGIDAFCEAVGAGGGRRGCGSRRDRHLYLCLPGQRHIRGYSLGEALRSSRIGEQVYLYRNDVLYRRFGPLVSGPSFRGKRRETTEGRAENKHGPFRASRNADAGSFPAVSPGGTESRVG